MVLLDGRIIGHRGLRDGININAAPRLKFILLWRLRLAGSGMATCGAFDPGCVSRQSPPELRDPGKFQGPRQVMPGLAPGPLPAVFTHDAADCRLEHDHLPSARRNDSNNTGPD